MRDDVIQGSFPHAAKGGAIQLSPQQLARFTPAPGIPLPANVRQKMEKVFGTSFADVRIHVDGQAGAIGATAFTRGTQIHIAPHAYNPATTRGQQLIGHELAHVVQQRSGRVRNPFQGSVAVVHDARLEAEAEQMGRRAIAMETAAVPAAPVAPARPQVLQGRFRNGLVAVRQCCRGNPNLPSAFTLPQNFAHFGRTIGQPMPPAVLQRMEKLFGASFAAVRVHANAAIQHLDAPAITRGTDIYFAPGEYQPHTPAGQSLLAHELTHVIQQRAGRARNPFGNGAAVVHDQRLEAEAFRMAAAVRRTATIQRLPSNNNDPTGNADGLYRDRKTLIDYGGKQVPSRITYYMKNPRRGSPPMVDPPGWRWLRQHVDRLKGSWVRFHIINQLLGGRGDVTWNLVPATVINNRAYERNFERYVKNSALTNDEWTYLDVQLTYDPNWNVPIPSRIDGEWGKWNAGKAQWEEHGDISLNEDITHILQGGVAYLRGHNISLTTLRNRGVGASVVSKYQRFLRSYKPPKPPRRHRDNLDYGLDAFSRKVEELFGDEPSFTFDWVKDIWFDEDTSGDLEVVVKAL